MAPELGSLAFLVAMGYIDHRSMSIPSSLKPQHKFGKFHVAPPISNVLIELLKLPRPRHVYLSRQARPG